MEPLGLIYIAVDYSRGCSLATVKILHQTFISFYISVISVRLCIRFSVADLKLLYANVTGKNTNFLFACKTGDL